MNKKIASILMIIICISINFFNYEICAVEEKNVETRSIMDGAGIIPGIVETINGIQGIESTVKSPITNPGYYKPDSQDTANGADKLKNIGNAIIGTLQVIGSVISVAVLVVLGIKYMIGSAEERAEYKRSMIPYIIGAIMVFAITNLIGIVAEIAKAL